MDRNNDIDNFFKQNLEHFAPVPPPHVWEGIASGLAAQRRSKRRMIIWWSSAASVAVLVTLGGLLFFQNSVNIVDHKTEVADVAIAETSPSDMSSPTNVFKSKKGDNETDELRSMEVVNAGESSDFAQAASSSRLASESVREAKNKPLVALVESGRGNSLSMSLMQGRQAQMVDAFSVSSVSVKSLASQADEKRKREFTKSLLMAAAYPSATASSMPDAKKDLDVVLAGMASPSFSHHSESSVKSTARSGNSDEQGVLTMGGGLNVRLETRSRWSFESGVLYSRIGQSEESGNRPPLLMSSSSGLLADEVPPAHVNSMGTIKVRSTGLQSSGDDLEGITYSPQRYGGYQGDIRQLLDYIEVPLLARYRLINKQLDLSLTGGFSANFLADNNAYLVEDRKKTYVGYTQGMDAFSVSSSLGLSLEVPLYKSVFFNMEPRFKYFLTPVNSHTGYTPYSFSMLAGFGIRF